MAHRASTSAAGTAAAAKDPLRRVQMDAGRVAKFAGIWAKKAKIVLLGDTARLMKGTKKALLKGGAGHDGLRRGRSRFE